MAGFSKVIMSGVAIKRLDYETVTSYLDTIRSMMVQLVEDESEFLKGTQYEAPWNIETIPEYDPRGGISYGAFLDGKLVGYVYYDQDDKCLESLYIDREYRGHGIGKRLSAEVLYNHQVDYINVITNNIPATLLYKGLGYKLTEDLGAMPIRRMVKI